MNAQDKRKEEREKLAKMKEGTIRLVSRDGVPSNLEEFSCNGIPLSAKKVHIVIEPHEPIIIVAELYLDELDIELEGAKVTFEAKKCK